MHSLSLGSTVAVTLLLGMVVTVVTNIWRAGDIDLSGRHANMPAVYGRAILVGTGIALLARVNLVMLLRGDAIAFSDWLRLPAIYDDLVGVVISGVILAFVSKFWNDLFDAVYELKRFARGKANALKPDEPPRPRSTGTRRGGRSSGRRGGGRGRGGGGSSRNAESPS